MTRQHLILTTLLLCSPLTTAPARGETAAFDLSALNPFSYPEGGLVKHTPGVREMLIQVDAFDSRADITQSAYSVDVTVNENNTSLTLSYQQATRAVMTATVTPGKRQIVLQEDWLEDETLHRVHSTKRFNAAGCNLSTTDLFWDAPLVVGLPPVTRPPATKREHQTFCDARGRPTKLIAQIFSPASTGKPFTQVSTWTWKDTQQAVVETGWESESKRFFDARGNPVTEFVSAPAERSEIKTTYVYDAKGNWVKRVVTVRDGPEEAKSLPVVATETTTRDITYW
ncbi:hypothetical protein GCM10017781_44240 [Deinococcus metalli]|nr:hypothetical protein GCM10017781_44240 [Deinococcus metalli]